VQLNTDDIDINHLLVKPIYIGLLINIFLPVVILLIAYYLDKSGMKQVSPEGESIGLLFWILVAVSVVDGVAAIYVKYKMFFSPMITSEHSFEEDLASRTFLISIICFALIAAISIYGLVFYILGGSFDHLLFFVFISFIAFQLIRPRARFLQKVISAQEVHVKQGRFAAGRN
jgi:hypothetical protein